MMAQGPFSPKRKERMIENNRDSIDFHNGRNDDFTGPV